MNGSMKTMRTEVGEHSAELRAIATADHIVYVAPDAAPEIILQARRLEIAIIEALTPHHQKVHDHEGGKLDEHGDAHLATELDPGPHLEEAVASVVKCAVGTRWEDKFREPAFQNVLRGLLATHIASNMHDKRSWHVDRNPDGEHAKAFRARHYG